VTPWRSAELHFQSHLCATAGRFTRRPEFWVCTTFVNPTIRVGWAEPRTLLQALVRDRLPAPLSDCMLFTQNPKSRPCGLPDCQSFPFSCSDKTCKPLSHLYASPYGLPKRAFKCVVQAPVPANDCPLVFLNIVVRKQAASALDSDSKLLWLVGLHFRASKGELG
jgi:hypothetical protein